MAIMKSLRDFANAYPLFVQVATVFALFACVIALDGPVKSLTSILQMYPWSGILLVVPELMPAA